MAAISRSERLASWRWARMKPPSALTCALKRRSPLPSLLMCTSWTIGTRCEALRSFSVAMRCGNDPAADGVQTRESPGGEQDTARVAQGEGRTQMTITTVTPMDTTTRVDGAAPTIPDQRTESTAPAATTRSARPEMSAEDLDAQSPAADLVRVYLNGIGK